MRGKARWLAAALAVLAVAASGAALMESGGGTPAGAQTGARNDDLEKLKAKLQSFTTVGGRPGDVGNRSDLEEAIKREAARIAHKSSVPPERGGGTSLEELERLKAKLDLFTSLGGDPTTLEGVRADLRRAIEDELRQLREREARSR